MDDARLQSHTLIQVIVDHGSVVIINKQHASIVAGRSEGVIVFGRNFDEAAQPDLEVVQARSARVNGREAVEGRRGARLIKDVIAGAAAGKAGGAKVAN